MGFFAPAVRASSLRTSGFSEICCAVSDINYESHQCVMVSATCCIVELAGETPPLHIARYAVFTQHRSTSATLHACAMQPPAKCGSFASKTSLIVPSPLSLRWTGKASRNLLAPRLLFG